MFLSQEGEVPHILPLQFADSAGKVRIPQSLYPEDSSDQIIMVDIFCPQPLKNMDKWI